MHMYMYRLQTKHFRESIGSICLGACLAAERSHYPPLDMARYSPESPNLSKRSNMQIRTK